MGGLIVLAGMAAFVLWVYYFGPRTQNQNHEQGGLDMNSKFYEQGDIIDVGKTFTDVERATPYGVSEKSLVAKRDKAIQKASKKARIRWRDKRELSKLASRNLVVLTQETTEDLRDALREKFRSDLNVFVSVHNMRNLASLEKLKLAFEDTLTEAYAESSKNRMYAKMKVLNSAVEKMGRRVEDLKRAGSHNGNGKYANMALESYDRLLQDTIKDVEAIKVRLNSPQMLDQ